MLCFLFLFLLFSILDFESLIRIWICFAGLELRSSSEINSGYKVKHYIAPRGILCVLTHRNNLGVIRSWMGCT
jgi:hypothetical protein